MVEARDGVVETGRVEDFATLDRESLVLDVDGLRNVGAGVVI